MLGVLNHFGAALNTNCRCLQVFILPKLLYCTPVWCWVGNSVINDTTLQSAACNALRQKQPHSTETRMKQLAYYHFVCTCDIIAFVE